MSRIEELNDANIRVVYNDAGDIEALIDNKGRALNIPLVSKDVTGGITKIWTGTQAQYDAIATKADDTLYIIVEA